jgi:hypothetical protein
MNNQTARKISVMAKGGMILSPLQMEPPNNGGCSFI